MTANPYQGRGRAIIYESGAGGAQGIPFDGDFIMASSHSDLPNAHVVSDSPTITWAFGGSTVQAHVIGGGAGTGGVGISAGTQLATSGTVVFSNANGLSFGMSNSTVTGSYTVPSIAGLLSAIMVSAGTLSNNLSALTFSNGNGVSFGLAGSVLTASVATNYQSQGAYLTTAMQSNAATVFSNSNGVSFGLVGSTLTATVATNYQSQGAYLTTAMQSNAATISNVNVSAGTTSQNLSNILFSNSNGVSFGLNGSTVTATVKTDYQTSGAYLTTAALSNHSHGNPQLNLTNLSGTTASNSAGFTLSLSGPAAGGGAQTAISGIVASNATYTSGTVSISGFGGGITVLSNTGQRIDLSVAAPVAQSVVPGIQSIAFANTTFTTGAVSFSNANGISFGSSGAQVTASYTVPTVPPETPFGVSAGTQSVSTGTLVFSNSNGVTFGMSGSSRVTASVAAETPFGISGGTQSVSTGTVVFSNSNGISFGMSGSSRVTASYTVPSTAGLISAVNVSAGTTSNNLSAVTFSNSNGVSFGLNGSVVTATVATNYLTTAMLSNAATISNINVSAGTTSNNLSALTFSNSNGISFGLNSSTITASYTVPSTAGLISAVNVSAGTTSNNLSALVFSNSNGVSFGINGSTITASAAGAGAGGVGLSAGTQSVSTGTVVFSNSNNVTFGMSGSSRVTASWAMDLFAGGGNESRSALTFADQNGVSFGLAAGQITATVKTDYLTTAALSNHSHGNPTLNLTNLSGTTASNSAGFTLSLSAAAGGGAAIGISAGTQSVSTGTLVFSNSNNVTFGMSGSSRITASASFPAETPFGLSAGTQSISTGTLVFSDSNGISFGMSGSSRITASYTVPSTAGLLSAVNVSAGTTSNNLSAVTFSNSGGVSFGLNGSVVTATVATNYQSQGAYLTTAMLSNAATISNINVSAGTTSQNLSALTFSNGSGVTFGLNGSVITASVAAVGGAQTGISGIANSQTTYTSGTVSFSELGAITIRSTTGNQFQISVNSQTAQTQNIVVPSAGTQTATSGTVVFSDSNGISFGMSGSSQITASYTVPSTAGLLSAIKISAGTRSDNLSAVTFSNSNGVSFGLNVSTITASIAAFSLAFQNSHGVIFGTSTAGSTTSVTANVGYLSYYENIPQIVVPNVNAAAMSNISIIAPFILPLPASISYVRMPITMSVVSTTFATTNNAQFSASIFNTMYAVVYSMRTGAFSQQLQSVASGSTAMSQQLSLSANATAGSRWTLSYKVTYPFEGASSTFSQTLAKSTASFQISSESLSDFAGHRHLDIPFANSLSAGAYWIAFGRVTASSTQSTAALANAQIQFSNLLVSQPNSTVGPMGIPANASWQLQPALGSFSDGLTGLIDVIDLENVSSMASHPKIYFQFRRRT